VPRRRRRARSKTGPGPISLVPSGRHSSQILNPFVLFVCRRNNGRRQMAEAFLRRFVGDRVEIASAGTIAADRSDSGVVAAMAESGIDISGACPRLLVPAIVAKVDRVITWAATSRMCRASMTIGSPDPKGQSTERVREIRDLVSQKAGDLARVLLRMSIRGPFRDGLLESRVVTSILPRPDTRADADERCQNCEAYAAIDTSMRIRINAIEGDVGPPARALPKTQSIPGPSRLIWVELGA